MGDVAYVVKKTMPTDVFHTYNEDIYLSNVEDLSTSVLEKMHGNVLYFKTAEQ
jgi:hypothetical protein